MKTVAIIPAYNEQARIADAIRDAAAYVNVVVVVDDCSSDKTSDVARAQGAHVIRHIINRGQGAALQTGTDYALDHLGADVLVHFDADGQMAGEEIPMMIEPLLQGEADIVLGSRFLGKKTNMPFFRYLANRGGLLFTLILSGVRLSDTHNGFRALSRRAAKEMRITLDRMAHASQILDLIKTKRLRYVERPVTIRYTDATLAKSPSTMRMFEIVKDFLKEKFL